MLKHLAYLPYQLTPVTCFHTGDWWSQPVISKSPVVHRHSAGIIIHWYNKFENQQPPFCSGCLLVNMLILSELPHLLPHRVEKWVSNASVPCFFNQNALPEELDYAPVVTPTLYLLFKKTCYLAPGSLGSVEVNRLLSADTGCVIGGPYGPCSAFYSTGLNELSLLKHFHRLISFHEICHQCKYWCDT